jgi:hypothetical protein
MTALRDALTSPSSPPGRRGADGGVFAVLDKCARLVCNRLGVPLVEEEALRHLATEAVVALAEEEISQL